MADDKKEKSSKAEKGDKSEKGAKSAKSAKSPKPKAEAGGAREEKVRDIGACDNENQADHGHEHVQRFGILAA